ncbi:MAG: dienelactone hydrolase family protein [Rhodoferax sp.]|uniref:alpha/beta hydrolase n=1 Tax=Rhodoferax sp. TaxID=50421 RepID=UPI002726EE3D|nr:alpha/beta family hydrolase [Rhodoferax sp.]MDO8447273.1 dienelactone hydrolase family protein [Rhodoferax sp.]
MQLFTRILLFLAAAISLSAAAQMPQGKYLEARGSKVAVILAHGQGLDADSQVVSPLRKAIHTELGFHTLSLQMPTLPGQRSPELFHAYASTFPDAYARIQAGIDFLKKDKGVERIYLMDYSMGGRMTTAFLANNPDAGIVGYIGVGLVAGGPEPLNTNMNLRKVKVPVIDIYAENDTDAQFAANRKAFLSERFVQVPVAGAKHHYRGHEKQVVEAAISWLRKQEQR